MFHFRLLEEAEGQDGGTRKSLKTQQQNETFHFFSDLPLETSLQETNVQTRENVSANWWSYLFRGAQQTPNNLPKVQHPNTKREWDGDRVEGFKGEDGNRHCDIVVHINHGACSLRQDQSCKSGLQIARPLTPHRKIRRS